MGALQGGEELINRKKKGGPGRKKFPGRDRIGGPVEEKNKTGEIKERDPKRGEKGG